MSVYTGPVTKAKTVVASIGATVAALAVALPVVSDVLSDEKVDVGEVSSLIAAFIALAGTVYAVWKVPNRPVNSGQTSKI